MYIELYSCLPFSQEVCVLLVLSEAADISKLVKRSFEALSLAYATVIAASAWTWDEMPDWDPDAKIEPFSDHMSDMI